MKPDDLEVTGSTASVAGLLVTTEAMIAEAPKKESAGGGAGMPGRGGGGTGRGINTS